jgi:hypothetical protein
MAWAALIPVAMQLLKGEEKQAPQGPQMPAPPSIGDIFKSNAMAPTQHELPTVTPYQAGPVGGGNRGF